MNTETTVTQAPSIEKPKRKRRLWLRILLGILILICGIVIGAGGTAIAVGRTARAIFEHPEDLPGIMTKNMRHRLGLSDEQAEKVRAVLETRIGNISEIMREAQPRLRSEIDKMHDEIVQILDEKQKEKWERRFRRFHRFLPPADEMKKEG